VHSLNRLIALCGGDLTISDTDMVNSLDGLYLDSRYPSALGLLPDGKPAQADVKAFLVFASTIHSQIKAILEGEGL
jgi:hypothetical protein